MRKSLLAARVAAGLCLCVALPSTAEDGAFGLRYASLGYSSSTATLDGERDIGYLSLGLAHDQTLSEQSLLRLKGRLGRHTMGDHDAGLSRLVEAYLGYRSDSVSLRLGQQQVVWGKADGINPTAFLTPVDYTSLLLEDEDRRLSILAARTDVAVSEANKLSLVVTPHFTGSRLPWDDSLTVERRTIAPDEGQPQIGVRYESSRDDLDWSMSAFSGYALTPRLEYAGLNAAAMPVYLAVNDEIRSIGADFARNLGHWGVRGEAAYCSRQVTAANSPVKSGYSAVIGADTNIANWNINLQALIQYAPGLRTGAERSPEPVELSRRYNQIINGQLKTTQPGMTTRVSAHWLNQTLQTELLAAAYARPDNFYLKPALSYSVSDHHRISTKAEYFAGPDASFFGLLKKNSRVVFEYTYFP